MQKKAMATTPTATTTRLQIRGGLVALLFLVLLLLSHIPSSAPASSDPLGDLVAKARGGARTNATSSSFDPSMLTPPGPSSSFVSGDEDQQDDTAAKQDKEKEKEKENDEKDAAEKEKQRQQQVEEEKQAAAESKEYAKEKGLVSPTNGTGSYRGMAREFIDGHNELRARYGVPPLVWDRTVARQARRWSTAMRKDCQLLHSGTKHCGESVFRSHDDWNATAKDAVHWWGTEEPLYDKDTGKCNGGRHFKECGHFALMVSKKYQKLGCGRAECYKGGVFITCNYYKHKNATAPSPSPSSSSSSSSPT